MSLIPLLDIQSCWAESKLDWRFGKQFVVTPVNQEFQLRVCSIHQDLICWWLLNINSYFLSISRQLVCLYFWDFLFRSLASNIMWLCKLTVFLWVKWLPHSSTGILASQVFGFVTLSPQVAKGLLLSRPSAEPSSQVFSLLACTQNSWIPPGRMAVECQLTFPCFLHHLGILVFLVQVASAAL